MTTNGNAQALCSIAREQSKLSDYDNLSVALSLTGRGLFVFPIRDWLDGEGWKPIRAFPANASDSQKVITEWWRKWPEARIGLLCGKRSGITVLDVDEKNGKSGTATLAALGFPDVEAMSPVRVRSPSGGWHLFFRYDPRLGNSAGKLGLALDVKTEGGFVVAPGSYKAGKRYEPQGAALGTVDLPLWPEALLPPPKQEYEPAAIVTDATDYQRSRATEQLERLARDIAATTEGTRHDDLNGAAFWAGGAGAHGFLTREQVDIALHPTALAAGLSDDEAKRTIKAGWRDGFAEPIEPYPREEFDYDALFDDLPALIPEDGPIANAPKASRLRFLTPGDCAAAPSRGYVVKGLIAPEDVGCIFGPPGAGKSLIAPHIGYHVAQGRAVFGLRTKPGKVFFVAAEDPHGMSGRVSALQKRHGSADVFLLVDGVSDLLRPDSPDLLELRKAVKEQKPALIFIDTLAMAFPGLEENSADGMGRVVAVARTLTRHGAAVILIHHDTKSGGPTPRGHSLLNGALDWAMQLEPKDDSGIVRGTLRKNRNGSCDQDFAFRIAAEAMGTDEDGDIITYALLDELTAGAMPKRKKLAPAAAAALAILRNLAVGPSDVTEAAWRDACIIGHAVSPAENPDSRKTAFNRASHTLLNGGHVWRSGDMVGLESNHSNDNGFDVEEDLIG